MSKIYDIPPLKQSKWVQLFGSEFYGTAFHEHYKLLSGCMTTYRCYIVRCKLCGALIKTKDIKEGLNDLYTLMKSHHHERHQQKNIL